MKGAAGLHCRPTAETSRPIVFLLAPDRVTVTRKTDYAHNKIFFSLIYFLMKNKRINKGMKF
jgi:hypothetical protein